MGNKTKKVSQNDADFFKTDYSKIPKPLKGIIKPKEETIEKTRNIVYDGNQYLVRFPNEISKTMGMGKKDKIKFTLKIPPSNRGEKILNIKYVPKNQ